MRELLGQLFSSRWGSTKFWLIVGTYATFTVLLWHGKLGGDNYMLLVGGEIGAYLGVNLLQHRTYAAGAGAGEEPKA